MSVVKSDLIKELAENYPNFLKKDLIKLFDISIYEMLEAIKRGERVELRENFSIEPRIQKARISRNPKTGEPHKISDRNVVSFKASKKLRESL